MIVAILYQPLDFAVNLEKTLSELVESLGLLRVEPRDHEDITMGTAFVGLHEEW